MDKRKELMDAAVAGIREYLGSTRGANAFGPNASRTLTQSENSIVIVAGDGEVVMFDVTVM